jgi:hypothetical protein
MLRILTMLLLAAPALAAEPLPPPAIIATTPQPFQQPTRILDAAAADRLLHNKGVALQWIDWNARGTATVTRDGPVWHLRAAQVQAGGAGRLWLDGDVTEIGRDYFTFEGTIRITDTPDAGRACEKTKPWHFAVTQNRRYWRLREFEWCDGLTDYVDIYF